MRAGSSSRSNGREWAEKFAYCPSKPTEQAAGETHHILRESDEQVSWTGCSWRKQVTLSVFCSASIFLPATMKAEARMDHFIELRSHGISRASIEPKIAFAHNRCCCFVVAKNSYLQRTPRVQIRLESVIRTS